MALAEKTYLFQTDEEKHKHLSLLSTNLQHLRYSGLWPFIINSKEISLEHYNSFVDDN